MVFIELGKVPAWGVFLILTRELAIAGWWVNQTTITGANIWGKLNGEKVLELLIEDYQAQGKPLPEPLTANVSFRFV